MEERDRLRLKAMLALLHEGECSVVTLQVLSEGQAAGATTEEERRVIDEYLAEYERMSGARKALADSLARRLPEIRSRLAS